jgi:hypothetical protein
MDENAINWIEDLKKVSLKPGDVLVFKTTQNLSKHQIASIKHACSYIFPDHKIIILEPGMELSVVSGEIKQEGSNHA